MAFTQKFQISDAFSLGLDFIEIRLTNWGNFGTDQDDYSVQFPSQMKLPGPTPVIPSMAGIAIHPESEVDRCIVRFSPGIQIVPPSPVIPFDQVRADEFVLSVDAPIVVTTPGPITIRAHETSFFNDIYFREGASASSPFGGLEPKFKLPTLRLQFYLRPPLGVPGRVPFYFPDGASPVTFPFLAPVNEGLAGGPEQLLCIVPMTGRGHVQCSFKPDPLAPAGSIIDVRIAAIDVDVFTIGSGANYAYERTIGTITGLSGAAGATGDFAQPITAQYLAVYYTVVAATDPDRGMRWMIRATDCCDGRNFITPSV